ncbi:MAG: RES domain-containing protein [Actinomycetota bacterium]|nr:RES domain-containing protein [Actinomycetota bacterium]
MTEPYFSAALAQAVDDLGPNIWSGTGYRHTSPRRNALVGAGAAISGGRWNPAGISTVYLAVPRTTCLAEFRRMAESQGHGLASFLPRMLHTVAVAGLAVVDLASVQALASVNLERADLAGPWAPCQAVGAAAQFLGLGGVLAPSSTGTGVVIAVFETHVHPGQLLLEHSELIDPAGLS